MRWTDEQVENLKARQADKSKHPYNCHCGNILEPTNDGFYCSKCDDMVQVWAHPDDLNSQQEKMSEAAWRKAFSFIGFDTQDLENEAFEALKKAGFVIKEDPLVKALDLLKRVNETEKNFFAKHIIIELADNFKEAIAEKDKEIESLKNNQKSS